MGVVHVGACRKQGKRVVVGAVPVRRASAASRPARITLRVRPTWGWVARARTQRGRGARGHSLSRKPISEGKRI